MEGDRQVYIVKTTGERVPYDSKKLSQALKKAGASDAERELILKHVTSNLVDGMPSKKIFDYAYAELKKYKSLRAAGRFKLKQAIFNMGPSGYPFEIFVGRLFESFGYTVKIGELLQGKCVQHEVDVVAHKPGEMIIVETKFRSDFKGKTNVQVPLYIQSRFQDIKARWKSDHPDDDLRIRGFVVTNARFTQDAIRYAECEELGLISWDYPPDQNLKYYIDLSGLHPLTSLHSLKRYEQTYLLDKGVVLSSELESHQQLLVDRGIPAHRIKKILEEASLLIKN